MGGMRATNGIADFSHSSFNNSAVSREFSEYDGQPTFGWPATVIISHSSGMISSGFPADNHWNTLSFENHHLADMDLLFQPI